MTTDNLNIIINELVNTAQQQGMKINLSAIMLALEGFNESLQHILDDFNERGIEIITQDIEPDIPDSHEPLVSPFDPTKINIRMDKITIDSIVKRIVNEEFELDSDFQRKRGLWDTTQQSRLIESLLLRIPLPAFYFDANDDDKWIIIDGLQRINTLKKFIVDKNLTLNNMEFFHDLDNKKFDDLPRYLQRRIEETNVNAHIVDPGTPDNVKFNIFKRINTGGLILGPQEIRNALYQGSATRFIRELAEMEVFIQATCGSIPRERMLDREYCLRYIAFNYLSLDEYKGVIDDFLNLTMETLNKMKVHELEKIKNGFERAMIDCHAIMGNHAFRIMAEDGKRRPINKVLFEGWTYCMFRMQPDEVIILRARKNRVCEAFIKLCKDTAFRAAVNASKRGDLHHRIEAIADLINNILNETEESDT